MRGQGSSHASKQCFDLSRIREPMKSETRQNGTNATSLPACPPESPKSGRFGGQEKPGGDLTQGDASGSCPRLPWANL